MMNVSHLIKRTALFLLTAVMASTAFGQLHGHIHVGVDENDQLFIIESLDGGSDWNTVNMYLQQDYVSGSSQLYVADLCWNSARQSDGSYHLGNPTLGEDAGSPDWNINLKRVSFPETGDFSAFDKRTEEPTLLSDNNAYEFFSNWRDTGNWPDEYGRYQGDSGYDGTWRFHDHILFTAQAMPGDVFEVTFTVFDNGSSGYLESEEFTLNFVAVVPEPMTIGLLGFGGLMALRRRR